VAACENMISGTGMRPGDIVTASNGKTIEVWVLLFVKRSYNSQLTKGHIDLLDCLKFKVQFNEYSRSLKACYGFFFFWESRLFSFIHSSTRS
jgi:hypothetical protein